MGTNKFNAGGNLAMDYRVATHQGGGGGGRVEIPLVASCYRNQDKLWLGGPLGSYADFTLFYQ